MEIKTNSQDMIIKFQSSQKSWAEMILKLIPNPFPPSEHNKRRRRPPIRSRNMRRSDRPAFGATPGRRAEWTRVAPGPRRAASHHAAVERSARQQAADDRRRCTSTTTARGKCHYHVGGFRYLWSKQLIILFVSWCVLHRVNFGPKTLPCRLLIQYFEVKLEFSQCHLQDSCWPSLPSMQWYIRDLQLANYT